MSHILAILGTSWLVHLIGDFPLQNSFLATRKRLDTGVWFAPFVATLHGAIYSIPFLLFYLWNPCNPWTSLDGLEWGLIWGTHTVIDYLNLGAFWVRLYNWDWSNWQEEGAKTPLFVCIAIDQVQHFACNALILSLPFWSEWGELLRFLA